MAAGTVNAYVDFSTLGGGDLELSEDGESVTIRMPEAELDKPNLDQERTYLFSQERGLVDRVEDAISTEDQSDLHQLAEKKLAAAAEESGRPRWIMEAMEVLSSRILLRPTDPARSQRFYRDVLGLAVHREFGDPDSPGLVFFLGNGLLEVSGRSATAPGEAVALWLQVRDVRAEHDRLVAAGVSVVREPEREMWGLDEMWIEDPDGVRIVLVEVPAGHPLRRDQRHLTADDG